MSKKNGVCMYDAQGNLICNIKEKPQPKQTWSIIDSNPICNTSAPCCDEKIGKTYDCKQSYCCDTDRYK